MQRGHDAAVARTGRQAGVDAAEGMLGIDEAKRNGGDVVDDDLAASNAQ